MVVFLVAVYLPFCTVLLCVCLGVCFADVGVAYSDVLHPCLKLWCLDGNPRPRSCSFCVYGWMVQRMAFLFQGETGASGPPGTPGEQGPIVSALYRLVSLPTCVCVCVCVCLCVCIHASVCMHIHVCLWMFVYIRFSFIMPFSLNHSCVCICILVYVCVCFSASLSRFCFFIICACRNMLNFFMTCVPTTVTSVCVFRAHRDHKARKAAEDSRVLRWDAWKWSGVTDVLV